MLFSKIYRACKEWKQCEGRGKFFERMDLVRRMMIKTIEKGWQPGFGPFGKPYWMCCAEDVQWDMAISGHFEN
jgi:hypothetical protein